MVKRKKTIDAELDVASGSADAGASMAADTPSGRRKKVASSRIGRACDRCQHRKLACDPAPEGCPPCQKVNAWCTVTDPLTGTPTYRGEFEYLERQVSKQHQDIHDLVGRLKALGEDVSAYEEETPDDRRYLAWMQVKASGDTRPWDREEKQLNVSRHLGPPPGSAGGALQVGAGGAGPELPFPLDAPGMDGALKLPDLRTGLAQSDPYQYVGVAISRPGSGSSTKLNILGWQLDLAQVAGEEMDPMINPSRNGEPVYDRSYRAFIVTAFGDNPRMPHLDLPPKDELIQIVSTYVHQRHPFCPLFHAPTLLSWSSRYYEDLHNPLTDSEKVCLHMIVAIDRYLGATQGGHDRRAHLLTRSDQHYHFALGHFSQLFMGDQLADMQALVLISLHVRTFPALEIGWLMTTLTFNRLIQLGFHRSMKPPARRGTEKNFRENEIRKRVFWGTISILVTASGKLGRPMPLRLDDIDVEVPTPVNDEQITESGLDPSKAGECPALIGIEVAKAATIFLEMYTVMYATKRSSKEYMQYVGTAERRLKSWQDQWPAKYKVDPEETDDLLTRIIVTYLHFWMLEFRLILHHPSLSLTKSSQFNDNNLRECLQASKDMLQTVRRMQQMHVLDNTWYNCAVYLLAIQTTIYGYGQLKEELTESKLAELHVDMNHWLDVMKDIGNLLGSGRRLQNAVGEQIKIGMTQLENSWRESLKATDPKDSRSHPDIKSEANAMVEAAGAPHGGTFTFAKSGPPGTAYAGHRSYPDTPVTPTSMNAFNVQYAYSQQPHQPVGSSYVGAHGYAPTYPMNIPTQPMGAEYSPHGPPAPGSGLQPMFDSAAHQFASAHPYGADSDSWLQYTQTIPNGIVSSDYQPASALLQLGGRSDPGLSGQPMPMGGEGYDAGGMNQPPNVMWSLNTMDTHPPQNN